MPAACRTASTPRRSGDVVINLMPGWIEEREACRSMSGSMYGYDTEVPLIFYGTGAGQLHVNRRVEMTSVAPTLARLAGITEPAAAEGIRSPKSWIYKTKTMDKIQDEIIEEFSVFDDWLDKYDYLIGLSETLPAIAPGAPHRKIPHRGVPVPRVGRCPDGGGEDLLFRGQRRHHHQGGIIALLIRVLNGRTPQEVLDTDLYFIDAIGLSANLSPTRANGLAAMVKQMRLYALAFASKKE